MTGPRVSSGWLRVARALAFGVLTLALGTLAHVAGGETSPQPVTLLVLSLPVAGFALWVTREQRGPLALLLGLAGSQWLLHHAFMGLGSVPSAFTSSATQHHTSGMHMAGETALAADVDHQLLVPGLPMLLLHAAAVIVVALVLAHGEKLLALVVAAVDLLLRPLASLDSTMPRPWTPALVVGAQRVPRSRLRIEAVGLRGPP